MNESAIERELRQGLLGLSDLVRVHDRGVLVGFLLCLVPVLPVTVFGLAIAGVNGLLLRRGLVAERERRVIRLSFMCGAVSLVVGVLLALLFLHTARMFAADGSLLAGQAFDRLRVFLLEVAKFLGLHSSSFDRGHGMTVNWL
jgi:hypothetical protein